MWQVSHGMSVKREWGGGHRGCLWLEEEKKWREEEKCSLLLGCDTCARGYTGQGGSGNVFHSWQLVMTWFAIVGPLSWPWRFLMVLLWPSASGWPRSCLIPNNMILQCPQHTSFVVPMVPSFSPSAWWLILFIYLGYSLANAGSLALPCYICCPRSCSHIQN